MVTPTDAPEWLQRVIEQLAAAQVRSEERFAAVETQLSQLTAQVERLATAQEQATALLTQHGARLDSIDTRLERQNDQLGSLTGWALETRFIGRAQSLLPRIGVRDVRPLYRGQILDQELNPAVKDGRITEDAATELRLADLVCKAIDRETGDAVAIAVEVSARVGVRDVERAADRATLAAPLAARGLGVVVGERIDGSTEALAKARGVRWLRWSST